MQSQLAASLTTLNLADKKYQEGIDEYQKKTKENKRKESFLRAIVFFKEAMTLYMACEPVDPKRMLKTYSSLASCYRELGDIVLAKDYLDKALTICKDNNYQEDSDEDALAIKKKMLTLTTMKLSVPLDRKLTGTLQQFWPAVQKGRISLTDFETWSHIVLNVIRQESTNADYLCWAQLVCNIAIPQVQKLLNNIPHKKHASPEAQNYKIFLNKIYFELSFICEHRGDFDNEFLMFRSGYLGALEMPGSKMADPSKNVRAMSTYHAKYEKYVRYLLQQRDDHFTHNRLADANRFNEKLKEVILNLSPHAEQDEASRPDKTYLDNCLEYEARITQPPSLRKFMRRLGDGYWKYLKETWTKPGKKDGTPTPKQLHSFSMLIWESMRTGAVPADEKEKPMLADVIDMFFHHFDLSINPASTEAKKELVGALVASRAVAEKASSSALEAIPNMSASKTEQIYNTEQIKNLEKQGYALLDTTSPQRAYKGSVARFLGYFELIAKLRKLERLERTHENINIIMFHVHCVGQFILDHTHIIYNEKLNDLIKLVLESIQNSATNATQEQAENFYSLIKATIKHIVDMGLKVKAKAKQERAIRRAAANPSAAATSSTGSLLATLGHPERGLATAPRPSGAGAASPSVENPVDAKTNMNGYCGFTGGLLSGAHPAASNASSAAPESKAKQKK